MVQKTTSDLQLVYLISLFTGFLLTSWTTFAQPLEDDFEGNGSINSWFGDDCQISHPYANPFPQGNNTSAQVLKYEDVGGTFANLRFDAGRNLNLAQYSAFRFKIYVPSSSLTGNQNNQVSLKLQDSRLGAPWSTQCEVIKNIVLDQWQTITIDFASDPYNNLDPSSLPPTQRNDFNRVLIQVNGENNNDHVTAYLDDFYYHDTVQVALSYNQLVWADEFNANGALDTSKWFHQTQLPLGNSWYNGEIQHYTDRTVNASQSNGSLHLVAKKETFTDQGHTKQYTSARLNSKFAFTYGRIEVRAKLPTGVGTWPAIWTLGKNIIEPGAYFTLQGEGKVSWPACGEMDIMEHWGNNQNYVSSATHTPSSFGGTINHGGQTISTVSQQFHVYALEWTPENLTFSVDSVVHFVYQPTTKDANTWPFDADHYILLNIAIEPSIDPNFTQDTLEIDYVRVYQADNVGSQLSNDFNLEKLKPYPNPVRNHFSLPFSGDGLISGQNLQGEIFNSRGQKVAQTLLKAKGNELKVNDLQSLPSGIYYLQFSVKPKNYQVKFSKI